MIYDPKVPPTETVHIIKDVVVLLGEVDPFYVGEITCTSYDANTLIHEIQCQALTVHNRTLEQSKNLKL